MNDTETKQAAAKGPLWSLQSALITELGKAVKRLDPKRPLAHKDVHEARKSIRRTRAGLRWLRDAKVQQAQEQDSGLKIARARLSALRDAGCTIETIDRLRRTAPNPTLRRELQQWRRQLKAKGEQASSEFVQGRARSLLHRRVTSALEQLQSMKMPSAKRVLRGLRQSEKRARAAVRDMRGMRSATIRHAGRRRVRLLALQLQQAQALGLAVATTLEVAKIDRLAKAIGRENDLAVLLRRAKREPAHCSAQLCAWIESRRLSLIRRNDRSARVVLGRK